MKFVATPTAISDVITLEPKVYEDNRGLFFESFNQHSFEQTTGLSVRFVQDNHSLSSKNVLRGLHFQNVKPQGKLIRVTLGSIFDVAVDLRRSSSTFGKWVGVNLTAENKKQIWIPPGFAHGFLVTSDVAECQYKTTEYWHPQHEQTLLWNDNLVAVDWPLKSAPTLSHKDQLGKNLEMLCCFD